MSWEDLVEFERIQQLAHALERKIAALNSEMIGLEREPE